MLAVLSVLVSRSSGKLRSAAVASLESRRLLGGATQSASSAASSAPAHHSSASSLRASLVKCRAGARLRRRRRRRLRRRLRLRLGPRLGLGLGPRLRLGVTLRLGVRLGLRFLARQPAAVGRGVRPVPVPRAEDPPALRARAAPQLRVYLAGSETGPASF